MFRVGQPLKTMKVRGCAQAILATTLTLFLVQPLPRILAVNIPKRACYQYASPAKQPILILSESNPGYQSHRSYFIPLHGTICVNHGIRLCKAESTRSPA
jgi:hypothetical protein